MTSYRCSADRPEPDVDEVQAVSHDCEQGWLGEDLEGRPVPCGECRPSAAAQLARRLAREEAQRLAAAS